jgi:hypothetical protein
MAVHSSQCGVTQVIATAARRCRIPSSPVLVAALLGCSLRMFGTASCCSACSAILSGALGQLAAVPGVDALLLCVPGSENALVRGIPQLDQRVVHPIWIPNAPRVEYPQ